MCPMVLSAVHWVKLHLITWVHLNLKMSVRGQENKTRPYKMWYVCINIKIDIPDSLNLNFYLTCQI